MENDETLTEIQAQNKNKNILCGVRILDFFLYSHGQLLNFDKHVVSNKSMYTRKKMPKT